MATEGKIWSETVEPDQWLWSPSDAVSYDDDIPDDITSRVVDSELSSKGLGICSEQYISSEDLYTYDCYKKNALICLHLDINSNIHNDYGGCTFGL